MVVTATLALNDHLLQPQQHGLQLAKQSKMQAMQTSSFEGSIMAVSVGNMGCVFRMHTPAVASCEPRRMANGQLVRQSVTKKINKTYNKTRRRLVTIKLNTMSTCVSSSSQQVTAKPGQAFEEGSEKKGIPNQSAGKKKQNNKQTDLLRSMKGRPETTNPS